MSELLDPASRAAALASLPAWHETADCGGIHRLFRFTDFAHAFSFMTQVALAAEKADHHPDWTNVYNTVAVTLSTHDAGGVTARDIALAKVMDTAYTRFE